MSLNVCAHCTTRFSIGAPHCPQCGNADYHEEGTMAKITRHGGATTVQDITAYVAEVPEGVDKVELVLPDEDLSEQEPLTEYHTWLLMDLRDELRDRGLPVSGNKDELVDRLVEDDVAKSQAPAETEEVPAEGE